VWEHLPPASILDRQTRALLGVRTAGPTSELPRRSFSRSGGAWVGGRSVGTVAGVWASGWISGTKWHRLGWDASAGHCRAGRDGSAWSSGTARLGRKAASKGTQRFERRTSSVTTRALQGAIGVPPRCPPRTERERFFRSARNSCNA